MDNNDFNSLGLDGVTLREDLSNTNPAPAASNEPASQEQNATDGSSILNDLSDEETIDLFVEGIMIEKGVEAPTEEIKQDLKNNLKDQLLKEIDRSLIGELPDDKLEELNRLATEQGQIDPNLIAQMIEEAKLDVTDIVGTTMVRFREIYLDNNQNSTNTDETAEQNNSTEE
ncbi:hypothetical protein IKD67_00130 [Candidatus Saccharibacteria bacterium]|nr:hypothetical protein [Candidatus Saccharibacteria bacterium]